MNRRFAFLFAGALLSAGFLFLQNSRADDLPPIRNVPVLDQPPILAWPRDEKTLSADITDPSADTLSDLHGVLRGDACRRLDLLLSTEGNYYMALRELVKSILKPGTPGAPGSFLYTTSPPVSLPQSRANALSLGNLRILCRPEVAVASWPTIRKLQQAGLAEGRPIPVIQGEGEVLLVKKGNPLHIRSVWDLGRPGVRVVTPNPVKEKGAFLAYARTLYQIAKNDPHPPAGWTAEKLFRAVYDSSDPHKWVAGPRIHHRDEPWSVAYGHADVAILFHQLGLATQRAFPDVFDLVPLGGTIEHPRPLPGSVISTSVLVRIRGHWSPGQKKAREALVRAYMSRRFTQILRRWEMKRPEGFRE
ncbi:MAG: uncharacterized protein C75L2_00450001 [Leptospirillum sp. Group II 'C75']|jgi:hypothetical protein|uniref:Uncharacterized protein n=1 Tax=Leptospirillum sp. Group II '5-way CG' TaxID=419541 RepID=B6AS02_9BACT|nr:substrate-binding domain-containing protein [Leptospirillum sp. Group II 'CF-1']AKS23159.1 hypothetical protein ABH19_04440 [Leptospirillum sp. Group II 'CF-1']EAY57056.1 MAG: conserved protein of unknown function [Leptospirillum rubarum]EDZ38249.1 MAG: Conserved protein of unknown function [Leptospirillum sp. Group II '5-way CG']EIJ75605.1 MAG: uncharacterized protein C75L2_00450001 [Leptospirillum sp. Group II 'C75']